MKKNSIIINDLKINYYFQKKTKVDLPIVFLHGWGSQALHFFPVLKKCPNFVALDLPGFGESDQPKENWNTKDHAIFLNSFIQKLELTEFILVGHSFGGAIIIKYKSLFGFSGKSILIASAGIRQNKKNPYQKYKLFFRFFNWFLSVSFLKSIKEKLKIIFYQKIVKNKDFLEAGAMREIYLQVIKDDVTKDLSLNQGKNFLIWGDQDADTPLLDGEKMKKLLPWAKLFVIKDAGHFVFLDKKKEFDLIFFQCVNDF